MKRFLIFDLEGNYLRDELTLELENVEGEESVEVPLSAEYISPKLEKGEIINSPKNKEQVIIISKEDKLLNHIADLEFQLMMSKLTK